MGEARTYDVLCVGLAVGNVVVRPASPAIFDVDTTQVEEIAMMGGGDAFNQSGVLSKLGNRVGLVSRMAKDGSGQMMLQEMESRGVDTSLVTMDESLGTSTCVIMVREDGQRIFCTYKGCLRTFGSDDIDLSIVKNTRVVSIGGLFALPSFDQKTSIELFKAARENGTITVCDTKYDAFHIGLEGIGDLLSYTDYFFPSYDEATYLSGLKEPAQIAKFFRDRGAKNVGIKLGGDGCYVLCDEFEGRIPAFHVPVVDTTGAGDNFMGGFIHGLLQGWGMKDCAIFASAVSALAVTVVGPRNETLSLEKVNEVLQQTPESRRFAEEVMNYAGK